MDCIGQVKKTATPVSKVAVKQDPQAFPSGDSQIWKKWKATVMYEASRYIRTAVLDPHLLALAFSCASARTASCCAMP